METFKVVNTLNNLYELINIKRKTKHEIRLKFFDNNINLGNGDLIKLNIKLLDKNWEGYTDCYNYGSIDSVFGKNILTEEDVDIIKIKSKNNVFILKRLYG